jgi:hypothetical protein
LLKALLILAKITIEKKRKCVRKRESISKQYCMDLSKSIFSHLNARMSLLLVGAKLSAFASLT